MIKSAVLYVSTVLLSGVIIAGCSHKPTGPKPTAWQGTPEQRAPASLNRLTQEDIDNIRNMVISEDEVHFKQLLVKMRIAQTLVAGFDSRLSHIVNETEMDVLFASQLYCDLWRYHGLYEHAEEQLTYAMTLAKSTNTRAVDWIYEQISDFAALAASHEAAMGNLFLGFVHDEIEICHRAKCISDDLDKLDGFHMNPLDSRSFNDFMKANQREMVNADLSKGDADDLKPGTCFEHDPRRKPQATGFDWVNRNWVGSVLPKGSFVFTYDDGPHKTYTRAIRDTWAQAGLPKPAFFWLRQNASNLSEIVKELSGQGYVIGSHSERHADLGNLAKSTSPAGFNGVNKQVFGPETKNLAASGFEGWKSSALDREINQSVDDLAKITEKPVRYFRLPFGSGTKNDLIGARFEAKNLDHFFWRVDSLDWQDKNPESIRDRVITQMRAVQKGIVLFHDIHPQSAQASKLLVDYLKTSNEMKAVSISEIPGLKP